jgi:hypothetical protein
MGIEMSLGDRDIHTYQQVMATQVKLEHKVWGLEMPLFNC